MTILNFEGFGFIGPHSGGTVAQVWNAQRCLSHYSLKQQQAICTNEFHLPQYRAAKRPLQ